MILKRGLKTVTMESGGGAMGNFSTSHSVEHSETPSGSNSQDAVLDLSTSIQKVDDVKTENLSSPGRMKTTSLSSSRCHPYHIQDDVKSENFPVDKRHTENPCLPLPSTSQDYIKVEGFAVVQYSNLHTSHQPVFNEQVQIKPECFPVPNAAYPDRSHCAPTHLVYSGACYSQPASFIPSPIIVPTTRTSVIIPSTVTAKRAVAPVPPTPIHSPENTSENLAKPYITNNFYPPAPIPHIPTVPSHSPEGPRGSIVGTSTSPAIPPPFSKDCVLYNHAQSTVSTE